MFMTGKEQLFCMFISVSVRYFTNISTQASEDRERILTQPKPWCNEPICTNETHRKVVFTEISEHRQAH